MRITREMIIANPTTLYVYGMDYRRIGKYGQCEECLGLPNTAPITTKMLPCKDTASYLNDGLLELFNIPLIDREIQDIKFLLSSLFLNKVIIFPKIGMGCADLQSRAPKTLIYIQHHLKELV